MSESLDVLAAMGGTGTTYQVTCQMLGRDRRGIEDWDFINTQEWVRLELRDAFYAGRAVRSDVGRGVRQWEYSIPILNT